MQRVSQLINKAPVDTVAYNELPPRQKDVVNDFYNQVNYDTDDVVKEVEKTIDDKTYSIQIESLSSTDSPFIITQSEFMRRMKEQQQLSGGMNVFGELPESYNLAVNSNHPITSQLLNESDENIQSELINQILDLALLSQGLLKGKNLTEFITRSVLMINPKK